MRNMLKNYYFILRNNGLGVLDSSSFSNTAEFDTFLMIFKPFFETSHRYVINIIRKVSNFTVLEKDESTTPTKN